ncbi:hypothetical protein DAI22_01g293032 [Oryza sativa Japonica Group]|nr:hypothetical protein DAI22_01g293032 [Oryza sativa Japonica Group]
MLSSYSKVDQWQGVGAVAIRRSGSGTLPHQAVAVVPFPSPTSGGGGALPHASGGGDALPARPPPLARAQAAAATVPSPPPAATVTPSPTASGSGGDGDGGRIAREPLRSATRSTPSSSPCCGGSLRRQRSWPPPLSPSSGVRRTSRRLLKLARWRTRHQRARSGVAVVGTLGSSIPLINFFL